MKISSASKKVLASALSAAMVVAFAPTVAFGATVATADTVTVTYDLNGGSLANSSNPLTGEIIQVMKDDSNDHLQITTTKAAANLAKVTGPNGYTIQGWFIDADNDGVKDAGEAAITTDGAIDLTQYKIAGNAITLKAYYSNPAVNSATYNAADSKIVVAATEGTTNHKYTLTVTAPDGTVVGEQGFGGANQPAVSDMDDVEYTTVKFEANPDSTDKMAAYKSHLTAGKYTAALTEDGKVISSETIELVSVTVKDGVNTPAADDAVTLWQLSADGKVAANVTLPSGTYLVDADGYAVDAAGFEVKANTVLTTTSTVQVASAFAYNSDTRVATVTLTDASAAEGDAYAVSVADPSGAEVYAATIKKDGTNALAALTFSFDQTANGARASKEEAAGTYVATVTKTAKADGAVTASKKSVVLTQVTYDLGDAKAKSGAKTSFFTTEANETAATFADIAESAPKGYSFDKWSFGGASYAGGKTIKLEAGKANTVTAVYKATDYASTPSCSVSKVMVGTTVHYYLTVSGTATGETVTTKIGSGTATAYTGPVELTAGQNVEVKVSANGKTDKTVTLVDATNAAATWKSATSGGSNKLENTVGNNGSKWLAADGVKAAIESGKAAYDALAEKYFVEDEALTAADLASYKALYEAVDAEANAQLKAYENGANVVAGKKVYYMTAAQYAANAKVLAAAEKTVTDALATKNATDAQKAAVYAAGVLNAKAGAVVSVAGSNKSVKGVVDTVNDVLTGSNVTENKQVTAADVTAAAEVTKALQAAKTADEAKAAVEAYNKLTDAQKKLVAASDVAAAQEIVSKAETAQKVKDAQDLAAARDLNGKKVTAKAKVGKKAQGKSFTYKLAASESGATASYAKVSGSKYIKISASGKVTFSKVKVAKKAKTYKAKVSVTYGTQTVTKTVQLVVKKK